MNEVCEGPVAEVALESRTESTQSPPTFKITITKVLNGYLVEPKDKRWNGEESVYLDLEGVIAEVRKNFS